MSAKIRGIVLSARKLFVEQRFGEAALENIVATLPKEDQETLRSSIMPSDWYDAELGARFDAAIIRVVGGDSHVAFKELGRQSAERNLARVHAGYLLGKTPMQFLEQTPVIYRQYYESGWREFVPSSPTSGALITHDAEAVTEGDCYTIIGWYEMALDLAGAPNASVTHPECRARGDAVCRYELSWSAGAGGGI